MRDDCVICQQSVKNRAILLNGSGCKNIYRIYGPLWVLEGKDQEILSVYFSVGFFLDLSRLDLVLVIVSLVFGFSLISVMLLLVWLAYHRRAIWLLRSAASSQACCRCLHPGGDLITP